MFTDLIGLPPSSLGFFQDSLTLSFFTSDTSSGPIGWSGGPGIKRNCFEKIWVLNLGNQWSCGTIVSNRWQLEVCIPNFTNIVDNGPVTDYSQLSSGSFSSKPVNTQWEISLSICSKFVEQAAWLCLIWNKSERIFWSS